MRELTAAGEAAYNAACHERDVAIDRLMAPAIEAAESVGLSAVELAAMAATGWADQGSAVAAAECIVADWEDGVRAGRDVAYAAACRILAARDEVLPVEAIETLRAEWAGRLAEIRSAHEVEIEVMVEDGPGYSGRGWEDRND